MRFRLHHVAIQTAEFDTAYFFFTKILKLPLVKPPFNFKSRRMCILSAGSVEIELCSHKKDTKILPYSSQQSGPEHIAFEVSDLDEAIKRVRSFGVLVTKEPFIPPVEEAEQPKVAFVAGPDGQEIEFRETSRTRPEKVENNAVDSNLIIPISELRIAVERENHVLSPKSYEAVKRFFLTTTCSSCWGKDLKELSREYGIQEYLRTVDNQGRLVPTKTEIIADFRRTIRDYPDFKLWLKEGSCSEQKHSAKTILFPARWLCHLAGFRHLSVHLFLVPVGDDKYILVQVRGTEKAESPGCFDLPVAGHVGPEQTEQEALLREAKEELGLEESDLINLTELGVYEYTEPNSVSWRRNIEVRRVFQASLNAKKLLEIRATQDEVAAVALFWTSAMESLIALFPERVASGLRSSMPIFKGCG